jgi:hypothetical protein
VLRADTCVLELASRHWDAPSERLSIGISPSGRQGHSLVAGCAGPGAAEVLLFGGASNVGPVADLWSLSATAEGQLAWRLVEPTGGTPPPRSGHSACALATGPTNASLGTNGNQMLLFGGRGEKGECLNDLWIFGIEQRRWSKPKVNGDVPRPRWAAACCVLPSGGPHGTRLVVDGGRDDDGWVAEQMLIDVHPPPRATSAVSVGIECTCQAMLPGGHRASREELEAFSDGGAGGHTGTSGTGEGAHAPSVHPPVSGHGAAACAGFAWLVGGCLEEGELTGLTRRIEPQVVRWCCPAAGMLQYKMIDKDGVPQLFEELIGPKLLSSTHTTTRVGDLLYVFGGHEPVSGLLAQYGGGLLLGVLHLPSLSWKAPYAHLREVRLFCTPLPYTNSPRPLPSPPSYPLSPDDRNASCLVSSRRS